MSEGERVSGTQHESRAKHAKWKFDAFGDVLCWFPDAAARLKRRSPVEDDGAKVSRSAYASQSPRERSETARVPGN